MTTITFSYKTTDFDTAGYLYNNNIFYTEITTFPLYNNLTDLKIIGNALLVDSVVTINKLNAFGKAETFNYGLNGGNIGTYFIDNLENINGYDVIGYIYSFESTTSYFVPGKTIHTLLEFGTAIDNGKTGSITFYVQDSISRIVTIIIND